MKISGRGLVFRSVLANLRDRNIKHANNLSDEDRPVGSVVQASASRAEDPGFNFHLHCRDFSESSHTRDLKIDTPVATMPGVWCYGVSAGTGWSCVSTLWMGEVERLICNFYLSVAASQLVLADPSQRYTRMLLGR